MCLLSFDTHYAFVCCSIAIFPQMALMRPNLFLHDNGLVDKASPIKGKLFAKVGVERLKCPVLSPDLSLRPIRKHKRRKPNVTVAEEIHLKQF